MAMKEAFFREIRTVLLIFNNCISMKFINASLNKMSLIWANLLFSVFFDNLQQVLLLVFLRVL